MIAVAYRSIVFNSAGHVPDFESKVRVPSYLDDLSSPAWQEAQLGYCVTSSFHSVE